MTTLALAFAAGLLSILSPCVLPLVPIVLGAAVVAHPLGAFALAAGLALSFTALGLLLALVGFGLGIDAGMFRVAAAAIMIALGAVLLVPSWQARLAAAGGPLSSWTDRRFARRRCWRRKDRTCRGSRSRWPYSASAPRCRWFFWGCCRAPP